MSKFFIPENYKPTLSVYDTQTAIGKLRRDFEINLCNALDISRVSAPLFVESTTGFNDDLNGVERPVEFDVLETGTNAQIVHSLAKWKRYALYAYGFPVGKGLYTDMNAIRRDEEMDNLHSIYVDQWDWEKVISADMRTTEYLKDTVTKIVNAICDSLDAIKAEYPEITVNLSRDVKFITTQELEDMYPGLTPKERENACVKEYKTVFLMQIGDVLRSGNKHDGRAPDYDDWKLNGDILFWNEVLGCAFEISSMGIRVDKAALEEQLKKANAEKRKNLPFHRMLLEDKLPLSMGGGIGQSRLCMLLLGKAHIGEVQVSVWDDRTLYTAKENGITIL